MFANLLEDSSLLTWSDFSMKSEDLEHVFVEFLLIDFHQLVYLFDCGTEA